MTFSCGALGSATVIKDQGGQLFRDYTYIVIRQELGPENGYLALLLDLGIVEFVFFMVPLIAGLRNALR